MKNKHDPRHIRRIKAMQAVFAYQMANQTVDDPQAQKVINSLNTIDDAIRQNAPKWPLEKINKVDLAILRCAIWEMLIEKTTPPKVIVDEAVELAKEFGTQSSSSFVNGVIGSIIKQFNISTDSPPAAGSQTPSPHEP